jgi:hypothetical protein
LPGSGECKITATQQSCRWSAHVAPGGATWLQIDGSATGMGNGTIGYQVAANLGATRTARIELSEDGSAACTITQSGVTGAQDAGGETVWTSHLDVSGGRGEVVVDGGAVGVQERGVYLGRAGAQTVHRVEARLVEGAGRPGVWRFEIGGPALPASVRPLAGNVIQVSGGVIAFHLEGRPGERLAFTWRTR